MKKSPELVTMSAEELDRLGVIQRVVEGRLPQKQAAVMMGLTARQTRRLLAAYKLEGAAALVSKKRGRPGNRRKPADVRERALALVRDLYSDFGPTLAAEKLGELHDLVVSRETLRHWMRAIGVWATRKDRAPVPHQPRFRGRPSASWSRSTPASITGSRTAGLLQPPGLRRRRHREAHGAALRAHGVRLRVLRGDRLLSASPRQARGVLQRQAQHLRCHPRGQRRDPSRDHQVRPGPGGAQHRHHLRQLTPGQGSGSGLHTMPTARSCRPTSSTGSSARGRLGP
jgi:hypothetical protein